MEKQVNQFKQAKSEWERRENHMENTKNKFALTECGTEIILSGLDIEQNQMEQTENQLEGRTGAVIPAGM